MPILSMFQTLREVFIMDNIIVNYIKHSLCLNIGSIEAKIILYFLSVVDKEYSVISNQTVISKELMVSQAYISVNIKKLNDRQLIDIITINRRKYKYILNIKLKGLSKSTYKLAEHRRNIIKQYNIEGNIDYLK